jgi:murein DD-endopeptidase MepM/ murein hydrolase activator NlpD
MYNNNKKKINPNKNRIRDEYLGKKNAQITLNHENGSDFDGDIFDDVSFAELYGTPDESSIEPAKAIDDKPAEIIRKFDYDFSMEISDEIIDESTAGTREKQAGQKTSAAVSVRESEEKEKIPSEKKEPEKRQKQKSSAVDLVFAFICAIRGFFSIFYRNIYYLGLETYRYSKRILKGLWKIVLKPLKVLITIFRMIIIAIDHFAFKSLHSFIDELAYLRVEVRSASKNIRSAASKSPRSVFFIILLYFKNAFKRHTKLFKTIGNTVLPIASVIVLVLTINYWGGATFALKVTYNNKDIGYIKDETVFLEAKGLVENKLDSIDNSLIDASGFTAAPKYELSLVSLSKLTDSSSIGEKLIEFSDNAITNACGIYVDGDFLCAVKNETDAKSIFDNILDDYHEKIKDQNAIVNFVEDIDYVQGLYPDNEHVIWDASRLEKKLHSNKVEAVYYTVVDGDNPYDIALEYGMTERQLRAINPQMGKYIMAGEQILVSNQVKYVQVKVIKTEQVNESVDYDIIKTNNSNYFVGDNRVTRAGVEGQEKVTYLVTYINGMRTSREEISRVRVKEPISKKVAVGTKSTRVSSGSGSYDVSISRGGFVWPAPSCHTVTSYYGWRRSGYHSGIDISSSGSRGKLIVASRSGTVESAGRYSSYGNQIVINHGNGIKTRYAHLLNGSISVRVGERVGAGQAIGRIGATGNATGPHLHFEIIINGSNVNPLKYLK